MSIENGVVDTLHASSSSDTSSVAPVVNESSLTATNAGALVICHNIDGGVSNETTIQKDCTIIHQQHVTNLYIKMSQVRCTY